MFRGINLCGAEINTESSEQHRTHLAHSYIKLIITGFSLAVKSVKLSEIERNTNINGQHINKNTL